jgi:hypothetical protein
MIHFPDSARPRDVGALKTKEFGFAGKTAKP